MNLTTIIIIALIVIAVFAVKKVWFSPNPECDETLEQIMSGSDQGLTIAAKHYITLTVPILLNSGSGDSISDSQLEILKKVIHNIGYKSDNTFIINALQEQNFTDFDNALLKASKSFRYYPSGTKDEIINSLRELATSSGKRINPKNNQYLSELKMQFCKPPLK